MLLAAAALSAQATEPPGTCATIGQAQPYAAWTAEDFTSQSSTVDGRIAVGGHLSVNHYSLGKKLTAATAGTSVLVGGNFTFPSGRIYHGNSLVGGSAAGVGSPVRNGLSANQSIIDHAQLPIDFASAHDELITLSQHLASLPANGTYQSQWGGLYLNGAAGASLQVFDLPAQLVWNAHTFDVRQIPAGATVVFNIRGASAGLTNMSLNSIKQIRRRVLFNFVDAESLTLSGIAVEGSILAPFANIANPQGQLNGTVMARSWNGRMSIGHEPFEGCLPQAPSGNEPPIAASQQIETHEGQFIAIALAGSDPDGDSITYTIQSQPMHGQLSGVAPNLIYAPNPGFSGADLFTFFVSDGELQSDVATVSINVLSADDTVPPPPEEVAPVLTTGGSAESGTAAEFLITGPNPIQVGADPQAYEPERTAVVRGRVLQRDGTPLAAAKVFVVDHEEYGHTFSRENGEFDLLVNGGGTLLIEYRKPGYLFAQRQADTTWRDFTVLDDVVLVPLDPVATLIQTGAAEGQLAIGSVSEDDSAPRQPTIYFPPGLQAEMILADGSTEPLDVMSVRMTEYTVGDLGLQSMPAPLPPTTAYTYAVELSVDQALLEGTKIDGRDVLFDRPVSFYVDNFMGFPVGEGVPTGYYDNTAAEWKAVDDGIIVGMLGVVDGVAQLDLDGSGSAAPAATLAAWGFDDGELRAIAQRFTAGQSFWRARMTHFSTWDCNWPFGRAWDAIGHFVDWAINHAGNDNEDCETGCIISTTTRNLAEEKRMPGIPGGLRYDSSRLLADGGSLGPTINFTLLPDQVPSSMKRVELEVHFLGRVIRRDYDPIPNVKAKVSLAIIDPYLRDRQGSYPMKIRVGYVYEPVFRGGAGISGGGGGGGGGGGARRSFGSAGILPITGDRERAEITEWWEDTTDITYQSAKEQRETGGWQLSFQHQLDVTSGTLMMGNGRTVGPKQRPAVVRTVAGSSEVGDAVEGSSAIGFTLNTPVAMAVDARGRIYLADSANHRVRRVDADGRLYTVAGTGAPGFNGDGIAATSASLNGPSALAFDEEGRLYIADAGNHRIRRIEPDGTISTVAGTGVPGFAQEGGLAATAPLNSPHGVATNRYGYVFIADTNNHRVWAIQPDGRLLVLAGGGTGGDGRALDARLQSPTHLATDNRGNVYVAESTTDKVRLVRPEGAIVTVAGGGSDLVANNVPATQARLALGGIAIDASGRLVIADHGGNRIRRVDGNGRITTIAGNGNGGYASDSLPALRVPIHLPRTVATDRLGRVLFAHYHAVRRIELESPPVIGGEITVADPSGEALHVFDAVGRHLRTIDALTGGLLYRLEYVDGLVTSMVDAFGNRTRIERDANGMPTALISPYNLRTEIELDPRGYLKAFETPEGHRTEFSYTQQGLMLWMKDAREFFWNYQYDAEGRLIDDARPDGTGWHITTNENGSSTESEFRTRLGRVKTYGVVNRPDGAEIRYSRAQDGRETYREVSPGGTFESIQFADGSTAIIERQVHPRFGTQALLPTRSVFETPGGLQAHIVQEFVVAPAGARSPSELTGWRETTSVNGRDYTLEFDKASLQFSSTTPEGRTAAMQVDAQRRPVRIQVPGLADVDYHYDARGRLQSIIQTDGIQVRSFAFGYDTNGHLHSVTDPLDRTVTITNDLDGQPTLLRGPDGLEVTLELDPNGNVTALTTPKGPVHRFGYDPADREIRYESPPLAGEASTVTSTTFDLDGAPDKQDLPGSITVDFGYDAFGRLNNLSRPSQEGDAGNEVRLEYEYDAFLPTLERSLGAIPAEVGYGYDDEFRLNSVHSPGAITTYGYDEDGELVSASTVDRAPGDVSSMITLHLHPQNGLLLGTEAGIVSDSWAWSPFAESSAYEARAGTSSLFNTAFERDALGRITKKTEAVLGATSVYDYRYDLAGRLDEVKLNGAVVESYTYDANGNRESITRGSGTTNYIVDDQDRLLSQGDCSYTYTANGELATKTCAGQTTAYRYTVHGDLTAVELSDGRFIEYVIDGRGRRVGKRIDGEVVQGLVYSDQLNPIAELDGDGRVVASFVYVDRGHVPSLMHKDGRAYRILSDHLGSVRLVVDAQTGLVAQRIDYDAWGQILVDTSPGFQPFGYAGGITDRDTRLIRFGARDYDAQLGRWNSKDRKGFDGGSISWYVYVNGDPINWIDPTGFEPCESELGIEDALELIPGYDVYNCVTGDCGKLDWGLAVAGIIPVAKVLKVAKIAKKALWTSKKGTSAVENALQHWNKHRKEFPELQNAKQYVEKAKDFINNPPPGTLTKKNWRGDTLQYDPASNTFGVATPDGTPRTMFRPKDGMNYWNAQ